MFRIYESPQNNKKDVTIQNLLDDKAELTSRFEKVTGLLNSALETVDYQKAQIKELEFQVSDYSSQVKALTARVAALTEKLEKEQEAHQKDNEKKELGTP